MPTVYILNGPNLNLLGQRQPEIYGSTTLADVERDCRALAGELGVDLVFFQSNHEGAIIDMIHEARQHANLDKLTGLYNRRFFDERLNRLLLEQHAFCLAMIDLDGFKLVNDNYGHQTGDVVLKRVAKLGNQLLEDHGWVCR